MDDPPAPHGPAHRQANDPEKLMPRTPSSRLACSLLSALLLSPVASLAQEPKPPEAAPAPAAAPASDGRIIYQVVPWVGGHHHVTSTLLTVPIRESDGRPLLGESLYQALGRPDLVAEFRARQKRRTLLGGVGAAIAVGGLVYSVTRPQPDPTKGFDAFTRATNDSMTASVMGGLVSLGGAAVMTIAFITDPNPVGEAERGQLIDEHNRALAPGPDTAPQHSAAPADDGKPSLSFQAGPLQGGGMAGLAGTF
jgi:hypothetical protein